MCYCRGRECRLFCGNNLELSWETNSKWKNHFLNTPNGFKERCNYKNRAECKYCIKLLGLETRAACRKHHILMDTYPYWKKRLMLIWINPWTPVWIIIVDFNASATVTSTSYVRTECLSWSYLLIFCKSYIQVGLRPDYHKKKKKFFSPGLNFFQKIKK